MANETTTEAPKGMIVSVLRRADGCDCTNNGVTSKASNVLLVGDGVPEIFEARAGLPTLYVSQKGGRKNATTKEGDLGTEWTMFGGNFLTSSDGRFTALFGDALPVHDRIETADGFQEFTLDEFEARYGQRVGVSADPEGERVGWIAKWGTMSMSEPDTPKDRVFIANGEQAASRREWAIEKYKELGCTSLRVVVFTKDGKFLECA